MHIATDSYIASLIREYARAAGLSETYAARVITGSGDTGTRLANGMSLTTRRAERIVQAASDRWPEEAEWPVGIDRPDPSPGSPALRRMEAAAAPSDPLAAVRAAADLLDAAMLSGDRAGAARREREMLLAASALGPDGTLASPAAACEALVIPRHTYDDVVRRYAGRPASVRPRDPRSPTARMLALLAHSGDVRFAGRAAAA